MEIFRSKINPLKYWLHPKTTFIGSMLLCLMLIHTKQINAAEHEQRVNSTITNVTVFLNQAQVTRVAKVSIQPGTTNLIFDRISPYINLNSLQVKTENNMTLLSVSQRNNFLKEDEKPKQIIDMEDSLQSIKNALDLLRIKKEGLLLEKEVLNANKHIGGANSGVKIEDLEDALALYRKRSIDIGEDLLKYANQEKKLQLIQKKLQSQLDEFNNGQNNIVEIVVTIKTLAAVNNGKIELTYLTGNTSWHPFYDIRVKDTKSPLQLVSKANITQATGEDWKNVVLKLSTANPNEGGTKPELMPLYLKNEIVQAYTVSKQPRMYLESMKSTAPAADGKAATDYSTGNASVQQTAVNIEFNVTSAYSIPSDNNPHQVDLTVNNLEAVYAYGAVPKLDKDAFVTARVSGNDLVNQISGEANIYFDGTFTGKTYINGTSSDSILLSLGRDKRIQIQRTLLKDFSSKTFSGSNKKELSTWEISIRNTRKEPIMLIVEDQIPVSTDKEIEVKLLNQGGAEYDETTGKLTWKLLMEGEKSQTLKFSFEIKYPKEKVITPY